MNQVVANTVVVAKQLNISVRRPRFLALVPPGTRPLSPISSSVEETHMEGPGLAGGSMPQARSSGPLPSLLLHPLNKLASFTNSASLSHASSRASTPTLPPNTGGRPLYEAESPDELALVDAAFA